MSFSPASRRLAFTTSQPTPLSGLSNRAAPSSRRRDLHACPCRPLTRRHTRRAASTVATAAPPSPHTQQGNNATDGDDNGDDGDALIPVESFRVTDAEAGTRIDKLLATRFNARSRTYIQTLLSTSCVTLDAQLITAKSARVAPGQLISVRFTPIARDLPLTPDPSVPFRVLHEDAHLLVVDKPAALVVHPAPGHWHGTLVHGLCARYGDIAAMGGARPGIVHRLDKGTSGALVIARDAHTAAALGALFARRAVTKDYVAVTVGNPAGRGCVSRGVDAAIGRSLRDRTRMAVYADADSPEAARAAARAARTHFAVAASDARGLLHAVRVRIETGRTHQIRVHARHAGAPVLGDEAYGLADVNKRFCTKAPRPMLHAHRVAFAHPVTGERVDVSARLPDDMRALLRDVVYPEFEAGEPAW